MTITSMKTGDSDWSEPCEPCPYGWGLTIDLTKDQVKALGLDTNPPKPGSKVGIRALAFTRSVDQEVGGEGDGPVSVYLSFQITDLEVTPGGVDNASAATLLYGA